MAHFEGHSNQFGAAVGGRIGWVCHAVRYAGVAYAGWALWLSLRFWFGDVLGRVVRYRIGQEIGDISTAQIALGLSVSMVGWLILAGTVYAGWRLMGEYLAGRVFSVAAAAWLSRVGLFGLAALAFDIVARPVVLMIAVGRFSFDIAGRAAFVQPNDLLTTVFLLAFVALGHVFHSAAELAEDHARIV